MTEYDVIFSDRAEEELQRIYLRVGQSSLQTADTWYTAFQSAVASLSMMPGRCSVARENNDYPDVTVRRLLYGKYRILFHVIEPESEGERGTVRVLRILHGASGPAAPEGE